MRSPVSVGFLRPREGVVRVTSWVIMDETGSTAELGDSVPDWDYQQDVRIICNLDANLRSLRAETDLPDHAVIRAVVQWHATGTGLRGASASVTLEDQATSIRLDLPGELLGGTLNLDARVVLGGLGGSAISKFSARRPGSVLWTSSRRTQLEGGGARFPVTPVSFANSGIAGGRNAAWCLNLTSADLSDSASGSLRVYLNIDNARIRDYLREPALPLAIQFARNLRFGVTRQLIAIACEHEELDIEGDYEGETLGELLATLVRRTFPDRDVVALRSDLRRDPGEFEAELQARTGYEP